MKNPAVKYATYALAFAVVWTMIEHFLGYNTTKHETGQYTRMVAAFVYYILVVVSVVALRKQQGGVMTFGQGCKTATFMSLLYSFGVSIWYAIYGEIINTQYKPTLTAFERSKLDAIHASPEAIASKMKEVDMTTGGSVISYIFLFIFMSLFGIVIGAVSSVILKRQSKAVK